MSVIWSGVTAEGAVVPVQVTDEGKVVAVGPGNIDANGVQKVAYLRDERPNYANGGAAIAGWQDRTLNTKEGANNLVVLSNDKEFTLSAGEYQIAWSAPATTVNHHRTKLTNVTDGTTQELGSSEFTGSTPNWPQTRSFGSARVKIATDTTYKIEHYCSLAKGTDGLGSSSGSGEPEVYAQVTITDLAIVGGALFADVVIGSGGEKWLIRESNGVAMLIGQSFPQSGEEKLRDLPNELDLVEAALNEVMEKLRMTPPAGWPVWDGSDNA